jgi:iron(III) transport system permease protein
MVPPQPIDLLPQILPQRSSAFRGAILGLLRDPWKVFALFALTLISVLIIVPQLWIIIASLREDGGKFTLRHHEAGGRIELIRETVKGFSFTEANGGLTASLSGNMLFTLKRVSTGTLEFEGVAGAISGVAIDANRARVEIGGRSITLSQTVPMGLFGNARQAVAVEQVSERVLRMKHGANAFLEAIDPAPRWTLGNFGAFLKEPDARLALTNSLIVTVLATVLAGIIGVSLAWMIAKFNIYGREGLVVLITMAAVSPPFLGAYAWRMLLGSSGILTQSLGLDWTIIGLHGVIWVTAWHIFPLVFLLSYDAFTGSDAALGEAAESLGASPLRRVFTVDLALALPGILTGLYLALISAFADFGTPKIISLDLKLMPTLVYDEFLSEAGANPSMASAGALIMVFISTAFLGAYSAYLSFGTYATVSARRLSPKKPSALVHALILGFAAFILIMAFVPHVTVLVTSFLEWRSGVVFPVLTLANYRNMIANELMPVLVSLSLASVATVANIIIGIGIAYVLVRKRYRFINPLLNGIVMLPYVIPGTVIGIGLILALNTPPLVLTGTWAILALSFFIRNLPYIVKSAEAVLFQIHPALEEAAISLGATPMRSFLHATLPLMASGLVSGATLAFLHAMTELSSTIVLYRPPWKPMTAVIFENTITLGADFGIAAAMTVLLMAILYGPLWLITQKTRGQMARAGAV